MPVRHDDLLVTLLGRALALLPPDQAEAMAEEVGIEYGRAMAQSMAGDGRSALVPRRAARGGRRAHRPRLRGPRRDARAASCASCRTTARSAPRPSSNPVICAVDRGMVKGMLETLYGDTEPEIESSLPSGDDVCVTAV